MKSFVDLSEERVIIPRGHTLSLVEYNNELFAYKGGVRFKSIELYKGKDIYSLKLYGTVIRNKRWAVAFVEENIVNLFCTYHTNYKADIFKYQNIYWYTSEDGFSFTEKGKVVDGSAPWICKFSGQYYLYFHRKTDLTHDILVKRSDNIKDISKAKERVIISMKITDKKEALSAPSIVCIDKIYWMVCEYETKKDPWVTVLYRSESAFGPFNLCGTLMRNGRACAFQYILGNKYILTYSVCKGKRWNISAKEGVVK